MGLKMKQTKNKQPDAARRQRQEYEEAWKQENTTRITLRLNNRTDADIIEAMQTAQGSKQGELRRLIRAGIAAERSSK
jgi:hypothetical protein